MEAASTWDSYRDTLVDVIDTLRPTYALEFGSGKSTKLLCERCKEVNTVEHNPKWFDRVGSFSNLKVHLEENEALYPFYSGNREYYDLVFIDGLKRDKCIENAHRLLFINGVVVLHDAERYVDTQEFKKWKYSILRDGGHTAALFDDFKPFEKMRAKWEKS